MSKILCVGDYIEDFYVFGTATRLCPEAPVPVVVPHIERTTAGGVGLVANQLRELGAEVYEWRGSFSRKERTFCGSHLVSRVDRDALGYMTEPFSERMLELCDAVVVSDYSKGAMTEELAEKIVVSGKPMFVDAKHHWEWYSRSWRFMPAKILYMFPNEAEMENIPLSDVQNGNVVEKLGARGCKLGDFEIPATVSEVVDVTGAGDIFIAAFVFGITSCNLKATGSLQFANELAGESCRHRGTFVVGREFAHLVLCKMAFSEESPQPNRDQVESSSAEGLAPLYPPSRCVVDIIPEECGTLRGDFREVTVAPGVVRYIPVSVQTPHQSPSDPTESSDAPTPERIDQEPSSKSPWEG